MKNRFLIAGAVALIASPALAGEPCRSAKDFVNMAQTFYGDQPELTNIIAPKLEMKMKGLNGHPVPSHMLLRHEGIEQRLAIIDGEMQDLKLAANFSKDAEMCRLIDGEIAPTTEDNTTEASLSFSFPYKRTDGDFTIDEIREGAKDGSKVMKGLAPGGLGFAVPGLKAIALTPGGESGERPVMTFSRKGEPVSVAISKSGLTQFVRLKDIKSAKADRLKIDGAYILTATFKFDPEQMAEIEAKRLALSSEAESKN